MKYVLFQRDLSSHLTGGFRVVVSHSKPVSRHRELIAPLHGNSPAEVLLNVSGLTLPVFRLSGFYRVTIHAPQSRDKIYDFDDLLSLREMLRDLLARYNDQRPTYVAPLQSITASRLKAGAVLKVVEFAEKDWFTVEYLPEEFTEETPNYAETKLLLTEDYRWRRRYDVAEIERNCREYLISAHERQSLTLLFNGLATLEKPGEDSQVQRITQTQGRWFRLKVNDLRLIFELVAHDRVLILRMILRRDDETYNLVQAYREILYPEFKAGRRRPA